LEKKHVFSISGQYLTIEVYKKDPFDGNIFIEGKEIQIWMSKDSMRILKCLINFIKDLIVRKSVFGVNSGVNWKKLKFGN